MEAKARRSVLTAGGLCVVAAAGMALALSCAGGRGREAPRPGAEPTLAERLKTLSPAEQLATMRALAAADTTDPNLAFYTGNAYYALGSAVSQEQRGVAIAYFDSAVTQYRRAVRADSTMTKAWVNMGLALEGRGLTVQARRALQSAIDINPRDVLAYCHLGYLEQQEGDVAGGIALYQRALAIDPNCAQAHYNLGLAFAEAKVFKEALVEWETVMRLDPDGELGRTAAENVKIIHQYLDTGP